MDFLKDTNREGLVTQGGITSACKARPTTKVLSRVGLHGGFALDVKVNSFNLG